jgi:uncharacterized membrane protein YphA (DoxX/SURF4 family)
MPLEAGGREKLVSTLTVHVLALLQGAQAPNAALTLNRVALGAFFAISGYHKLFNASRHATLTRTLQDDGVHAIPIMRWLLPSAEFSGGWALILGLMSVLAAFGLFGDLLYVPEALYCIGLSVVMLAGPGPWSLDAIIAAVLAN